VTKRLWRFEVTESSKSELEARSAAIGGEMNAQSTCVYRGLRQRVSQKEEMRRVGR
jgi:hypothetical protein